MTREHFARLLATCRMRDVGTGEHWEAGVLIEGITLAEVAELMTLVGRQLDEVPADARVNPEWLSLGEQAECHFQFHPDVLRVLP